MFEVREGEPVQVPAPELQLRGEEARIPEAAHQQWTPRELGRLLQPKRR